MPNRYSIAEARDRLPRLVHDVEKGVPIELTRRGKPVAALVSLRDYERLRAGTVSFWGALQKFRREMDVGRLAIDTRTLGRVRDRSRGRRVTL